MGFHFYLAWKSTRFVFIDLAMKEGSYVSSNWFSMDGHALIWTVLRRTIGDGSIEITLME